ncbi:MAG: alpha amylase C-terminal domain-containing protein [Verrucomicrobia bacterium]|nr:alpha amylase C-terminal domain-containing protein [Verrucomicrobiota bacterium]
MTFRVWAPNASAVGVKGQFNGWGTTPLVSEGGGLWSVDINGAQSGQEYKLRINNSFDKRDPRARRVTNSNGNSILYDPGEFDWGAASFSTPARSEMVIYEMHAGTYNAETWVPSSFDKVIERLDHLQNLGINAVEVMPPCEFPTDKSWGYNPADLFTVESALGGPDAFKRFVKACHERGIAVLVDVVHNHYGPTDLDMWTFDGWSQNGLGGIYFYNDYAHASTWWGNTRPDYSRSEVRDFIRDQIFMWLEECRVDGFRWDSVFNIIYYNNGANHNADGEAMLRDINWEIQQTYPGKIRIAEDHGFDYSMNFDSQWHVGFHDDLKWQVTRSSDADRSMSSVASLLNGWPSHNRVIYSESHDTVGDLNSNVRLPRSIDAGDPDSLWARRRALLAEGIVMTAPGVPMIFQGQEMHETWTFSSEQSLRWGLTNTYAGIVRAYRDMIRLRRNLGGATGGLRGTGVNVHLVDNVNKVLAYTRWDAGGGADDVVVVANFSINNWNDNSYVIQFPSAGTWYSHFNGDSTNYQADFGNIGPASVVATGSPPRAPVNMGMYSVQIFSKEEYTTPGTATFDPPAPGGCVEVKITYDPLDHPLKNAAQVNIYLGRNEWQDVVDTAMSNKVDGTWEFTHTIAPGTYRLDMVFSDGGGTWDNNGGADWHLSVNNCSGGTPAEVLVSPSSPQGCVPLTITYRPNEGPLQAATNIYLYIGHDGWLDVASPGTALVESPAGTWTAGYSIPSGTRRVNFVFHDGQGTWDNHYDQNWSVVATNCWPAPPGIALTNPVGTISVPHATNLCTLSGTATVATAGSLVWTNHLTGQVGSGAAASQWSLAGVPLEVGTNYIMVLATNQPGNATASDSASNTVYAAGWTNGSNGGTGWGGGWTLTAGGNAGHYRAALPGSSNMNLAAFGWGLWANSDGLSEARRPFAAPLGSGDVVRVGFENNYIETGKSVGLTLHNDEAHTLFEFYFVGGETNYRCSDVTVGRDTLIPWSGNGLMLEFELTGTTQYLFRADGNTYTGTLAQSAIQGLTQVRAWNASAGGGLDYNLYITELQVTSTHPPPAGAQAFDAVTIIRPAYDTGADTDGDGLPDWWEARFFNNTTSAVAGADSDGDGRPNDEEYAADTVPTNAGSFYPNRVTNYTRTGEIISLTVGPPTTNSRVYDVAWSTNLRQAGWSVFNLDQPGRADAGAVTLTVTNDNDLIFYRTGVKIP